jgi:hypothetical protein
MYAFMFFVSGNICAVTCFRQCFECLFFLSRTSDVLYFQLPFTRPVAARSKATAAWLLGSRVRISLGAWMFVCCVYVLCCPV